MTPAMHPVHAGTGWAPTSSCSPGCLPADDARQVPWVRVGVRLTGLAAVLLGTLLGAALPAGRARERWLRACCRVALHAAGVRLHVTGDPRFADGGGALVVANHLSWIDVLALGAVQPVRMLAKREVRDWPVIGGLAVRTGALFVDRAGLHGLPGTVAATADAMRCGAVVGVFPEGTTWCGAGAGPFRRAAFQAAIDAGVPVRPVAVALRLPGGIPAPAAAFVGDQTLWDSVCRVLRMPALLCELTVLPTIPAGAGADRRELAATAGELVGSVTGVVHPAAGRRTAGAPGAVLAAVA
jgi:1-acyl-sn-glycerol-3-phosphate acyltransferase